MKKTRTNRKRIKRSVCVFSTRGAQHKGNVRTVKESNINLNLNSYAKS